MNSLERAGWASVARSILSLNPGEAKALRELALNPDRFISYGRLDACSHTYEHVSRPIGPVARRIPTRIARIRGALADLGFPKAAVENDPNLGYAMPRHHADRLNAMIFEAASDRP